MVKILNIYHKDCSDGTGSAAAMKKKFGEDVDCIPVGHDYADIMQVTLNNYDEIYFTDFCLKQEDMDYLLKNFEGKVIVIDHHSGIVTMLRELYEVYKDKFEYILNNSKSGAVLTWEYFFDKKDIPSMVYNIQDRDLWKFELENTKHVTNFIYYSNIINNPETMLKTLDDKDFVIKEGKVITQVIDFKINNIYEQIKEGDNEIFSGDLPKLKIFNSLEYKSELGNMLSKLYNEPVGIYNVVGNIVHISIRSVEGQKHNAQEYAQYFGGNGHKHAAGCRISFEDIED